MTPQRDLTLPVDPAALSDVPALVWTCRADGSDFSANRQWAVYTGAEWTMGDTSFLADALHPDDRERVAAAFRESLATGAIFATRFRLRRADGRYRWFFARAVPLHGADGQIAQWIGIGNDVHDEFRRRERADVLAAVSATFGHNADVTAAMNGLLDALVPRFAEAAVIDVVDESGNFVESVLRADDERRRMLEAMRAGRRTLLDVSDVWKRALGGEAVFVPDAAAPVDAGDGPLGGGILWRRRLGTRSLIAAPLRATDRTVGVLSVMRFADEPYDEQDVATCREIAERAAAVIRKAQLDRDLRASEARYRQLADALPHLVGITAPDGRVLYLNETWTKYTGVDASAGAGEGWAAVIHPDDVEALATGWRTAVEAATPYETTYRMRRHDGSYRWFLNRSIPIRDEDGNVTAWFGTATDIDDRVRTEERLRLIADATSQLAGKLEPETTIQVLADTVADVFADWCVVYVFDERMDFERAAVAHRDPQKAQIARDIVLRYPPSANGPTAEVALKGEPLLLAEIPSERFSQTAVDETQLVLMQAIGMESLIAVPLGTERHPLGTLVLVNDRGGRRFDAYDLDVATMLGRRASIAIENARLYERRDKVARTLQRSFLPNDLPQAPNFTIAAYYEPGADEAEIGGDWYDALELDDGTIFLSIGDVAGRGLAAAIPMGKMRQAFRALTTIERDPSHLLQTADRILRREHPEVFVTAIAGVLDPAGSTFTYATAGHPAPFVRAADGRVRRLPGGGVPLGLQDVVAFRSERAHLDPGDLLVLMTDGLLEARRDLIEGEQRVARALADPAFRVAADPALLLRQLAGAGEAHDDTALLAVRLGAVTAWSFDARDRRRAKAARAAFVAARRAAGADADRLSADEIIFGELIGNVARYTPGPVDVVLHDDAGPQLELLDRGPAFAWTGELPDPFREEGRGQFLVGALAERREVRHLPGVGNHVRVLLGNGRT